MIPPRTRGGNVPQGRINCQTRAARAVRAACMEKIYEIPRARAARASCSGFVPVKSIVLNLVFSYQPEFALIRVLEYFYYGGFNTPLGLHT
jgi:hypothetical protein